MLSRRRWLAALTTLGAGVLAAPGQALAGLFGRKRQAPQCPCPVPTEEHVDRLRRPYPAYNIQINPPRHRDTWGGVTVMGTYSAGGTLPDRAWVKCYLIYEGATSSFPESPACTQVENGSWRVDFSGTTSTGGKWAVLRAELYSDNACTTRLDYDQILVKI